MKEIDVDKPVKGRLALWMSPALAHARRGAQIAGRIYVSPAMAYLLQAADDTEDWRAVLRSIPVEDLDVDSRRAIEIYGHPGAKELPLRPIDNR